jgi:hypothetical protein
VQALVQIQFGGRGDVVSHLAPPAAQQQQRDDDHHDLECGESIPVHRITTQSTEMMRINTKIQS